MDSKEAIKELKSYAESSWGALNEVFEKAIESIEKQIPIGIDIFDYGKAHCPVCKTDIHGIGKIAFCFKCGQKLEW